MSAETAKTAEKDVWRFIYNPAGDVTDVVSYGAAVAEGRIAGKYQLSTTTVPDTVILQRSTKKGIVAGADVKIDRETASDAGIGGFQESCRVHEFSHATRTRALRSVGRSSIRSG